MEFLKVSALSKKEKDFTLKDISFIHQKGSKLALIGETGSGKTTLVKIIGGLAQADKGAIFFEGIRVPGTSEKLLPGHPGIAYMSQHFELPTYYRVEELLEYANTLPQQEADQLFEVCRISHLVKRRSDQLSGGERQRIALARILITGPRLLLLDEPYSNLDLVHKQVLQEVIRDVIDRLGVSCILVSHDPMDVLSWSDRLIVLKGGEIVQDGRPDQVYNKPLNTYVAGLLGPYNMLTPDMIQKLDGLQASRLPGQFIIRPEGLFIVGKEKGIKGIVKGGRFFGRFKEIDVVVDEQVLRVQVDNQTFRPGDAVFLGFKKDALISIEPGDR
jgi:iron(III) transport system ATP-binding protein